MKRDLLSLDPHHHAGDVAGRAGRLRDRRRRRRERGAAQGRPGCRGPGRGDGAGRRAATARSKRSTNEAAAWRDAAQSAGSGPARGAAQPGLPRGRVRRSGAAQPDHDARTSTSRSGGRVAASRSDRAQRGARVGRRQRLPRLSRASRELVDFGEVAAIAAALARRPAAQGSAARRPRPRRRGPGPDPGAAGSSCARWSAEGRDDLFIAEDSQQRIYGQRVVARPLRHQDRRSVAAAVAQLPHHPPGAALRHGCARRRGLRRPRRRGHRRPRRTAPRAAARPRPGRGCQSLTDELDAGRGRRRRGGSTRRQGSAPRRSASWCGTNARRTSVARGLEDRGDQGPPGHQEARRSPRTRR